MKNSQIREMILGLILHLDYDLYKDLTKSPPEDPEELRDLFKELESVVKTHLRKCGVNCE